LPFSRRHPQDLQERQRTWHYSRSCKAVGACLEQATARAAEAREKAREKVAKAKRELRMWKLLMSMSESHWNGNTQRVGPVDSKLKSEVRRCFYFSIFLSKFLMGLSITCPSSDRRFWINVSVSRSDLKLSAPATEPSQSPEFHRRRLPARYRDEMLPRTSRFTGGFWLPSGPRDVICPLSLRPASI